MTANDIPLYKRDPQAWRAYLAEGNAKQARKRVSADALIRNARGQILLVDPGYKPGWDLPGGMAESNEAPSACIKRETKEELGIDLRIGRVLCIEWIPPHGPWDDLLAFIFDGGSLRDDEISTLRLLDGELNGYEFCSEHEAKRRLSERTRRRLQAALDAVRAGTVVYMEPGLQ